MATTKVKLYPGLVKQRRASCDGLGRSFARLADDPGMRPNLRLVDKRRQWRAEVKGIGDCFHYRRTGRGCGLGRSSPAVVVGGGGGGFVVVTVVVVVVGIDCGRRSG